MGKQRKKTRISGKVDELPEEIRQQVDVMLVDTSNTYLSISLKLKDMGYEVSKSSIGRYALRTSSATQRLLEAQAQTEQLDADYTEAGLRLLMDGLINKLATAEEEFDALPLEKAGRLLTSLSRTKVYKDRVKQDMQKKADLAFSEMEDRIMKLIRQDPEAAAQLRTILQEAKDRMMQDD